MSPKSSRSIGNSSLNALGAYRPPTSAGSWPESISSSVATEIIAVTSTGARSLVTPVLIALPEKVLCCRNGSLLESMRAYVSFLIVENSKLG